MKSSFYPFICTRCTKRLRLNQTSRRVLTTSTTDPVSAPSPMLTPQSQTLHSYLSTTPPTPQQLSYANRFFARSPAPRPLWTTPHFRSFPVSPYPEVCFLGRSNVGKSSLLNALFKRPRQAPAKVSKRPGRTKTMNAFAVGKELTVNRVGEGKEGGKVTASHGGEEGVVVVVDMPGYGAASREEWGIEIMKYLENRRQLRRTFVLIDAEHGLKNSDISILKHLAERGISHQVVISKVDKLILPRVKTTARAMSEGLRSLSERLEDVQEQLKFDGRAIPKAVGDILSCSAEKDLAEFGQRRSKVGITAVQWAVLSACGLDCDAHGTPKRNAFGDEVYEDARAQAFAEPA
ncbi:ribosome bioproteinsis GTP-binding protein YsxC [Sphaceloma murrayae]|uniref:Ribosome bioproteinsis GTP-binding protein YsxC n=1 Tax=Sphaceloma murrayae TaxID=2082308 RepID=A0A2K1QP17_9PEZI|nr:ribosome bioproteinsis GTP-binding protein YsxC [Sphaceloma murrayae]